MNKSFVINYIIKERKRESHNRAVDCMSKLVHVRDGTNYYRYDPRYWSIMEVRHTVHDHVGVLPRAIQEKFINET